jgi:ferredoxin
MGGEPRIAGGGGAGRGVGRGAGRGVGHCRREPRRDGSGRGAGFGRGIGVTATPSIDSRLTHAVSAPEPVSPPVARTQSHIVAVLAKPECCIACGTCVDTCPRGAISLEETAVIDAQLCNGCGLCVNDCSYGALELTEV